MSFCYKLWFIVDGGWTEWTDWSECSVTCSDGTQTATRECTNPIPEFSGKSCPGDKLRSRACKVMECACRYYVQT